MKSLLVIGAGSFSTEVEELAHILGYGNIAFLDDNPNRAMSSPVIGTCSQIAEFRDTYDTSIVALGNNVERMKYHNLLKDYSFFIPTLIHPSAYVSPDAEIQPGCIIRANAVVSRFVHIGESVILNVGALVDHHVKIGSGCHILMGAVIRNMVSVPPFTRVEGLSIMQ